MRVCSPIDGVVHPMSEFPDPVFAQQMLGPGLAIVPSTQGKTQVLAPVSGKISALFPHAFVIDDIMVHLGVDSKEAQTFTALHKKGDHVKRADAIIEWDTAKHLEAGFTTWVAVTALGHTLCNALPAEKTVQAGQRLFDAVKTERG